MKIEEFTQGLLDWIKSDSKIIGTCLVGSYARNEQKIDSDVDILILCSDPNKFISDNMWIDYFGKINDKKFEEWGNVKTIRVWLEGNLEIEFNFATQEWASIPVDKGTYNVIRKGMKILYDPENILEDLKQEAKID